MNPGLIYCVVSGYGKNSPLSRTDGHDANYPALAGALAGTGTAETPLCFTPVLDLGEAVESPHHQARGRIRRNVAGIHEGLFPVRVDGMPPRSRRPLEEEEEWE